MQWSLTVKKNKSDWNTQELVTVFLLDKLYPSVTSYRQRKANKSEMCVAESRIKFQTFFLSNTNHLCLQNDSNSNILNPGHGVKEESAEMLYTRKPVYKTKTPAGAWVDVLGWSWQLISSFPVLFFALLFLFLYRWFMTPQIFWSR